eukprot:TRINITY_DN97_c0_g2_i2.p1 TRINITY_DN97_c0_g2~~TRINITY_DN97_c0_g2_i2.p1  ORF type:complete len:604 (+),score=207.43 TRINITY_DN97_c0_g2_i2:146-1957(+)
MPFEDKIDGSKLPHIRAPIPECWSSESISLAEVSSILTSKFMQGVCQQNHEIWETQEELKDIDHSSLTLSQATCLWLPEFSDNRRSLRTSLIGIFSWCDTLPESLNSAFMNPDSKPDQETMRVLGMNRFMIRSLFTVKFAEWLSQLTEVWTFDNFVGLFLQEPLNAPPGFAKMARLRQKFLYLLKNLSVKRNKKNSTEQKIHKVTEGVQGMVLKKPENDNDKLQLSSKQKRKLRKKEARKRAREEAALKRRQQYNQGPQKSFSLLDALINKDQQQKKKHNKDIITQLAEDAKPEDLIPQEHHEEMELQMAAQKQQQQQQQQTNNNKAQKQKLNTNSPSLLPSSIPLPKKDGNMQLRLSPPRPPSVNRGSVSGPSNASSGNKGLLLKAPMKAIEKTRKKREKKSVLDWQNEAKAVAEAKAQAKAIELAEKQKIAQTLAESAKSGNKCLVVLDAPNIAMRHGKNKCFSCKGIAICAQYFAKLGFEVRGFVPDHVLRGNRPKKQAKYNPIDTEVLEDLIEKDIIIATPPQDYDDSYAILYAQRKHGIIVSNDMYRDAVSSAPVRKQNELKTWLKNHVLSFTFVEDEFMFNPDFKIPMDVLKAAKKS